MVEREPTEAEKADIAWDKAVKGEGLTPSESSALQNMKGFLIEPTLLEDVSEDSLSRLDAMASEVASEVQHDLSRRDVQDLVTGENVINIPVRKMKPDDNIRITPSQIGDLSTYYKNGRSADVRLLVEEIDRMVLPGFMQILSPEEHNQLGNAEPELIRKIHTEIMRMFLADRTNVVIEKLSQGIEKHVLPLLEKVKNPHARASIQECVDVWQANAGNPYVNFYERTARSVHNNSDVHVEYRLPLAELDTRYVSIGIIQGEMAAIDNLGAAYSDLTRTIFLEEPPVDEEMDFLEVLAAIHELTHVKYDAQFANQYGVYSSMYEQRTSQVPTQRIIGIIDEDPEAMGNEIELFIAKVGFGQLDTNVIARQLGVRWEEKGGMINELAHYAARYFPHGRGQDGRMSRKFIDYMESEYRRLGALIFQHDENGIFLPKE